MRGFRGLGEIVQNGYCLSCGLCTAVAKDGAITMAMVHYCNIAYRIGKGFEIDHKTGRMFDRDAMKLWGRDYEPGWEPTV